MTATEVLRRLLDERGVEWTYADGTVSFNDGERWFHAWVYNDGVMCVSMGYLTPEQAIAATLGLCNCSDNCTDNERTETCQADETDLIPFVRADSGDFEVDYIHVMECTECGHTYEHVNGDYEFCPRCGRRIEQ